MLHAPLVAGIRGLAGLTHAAGIENSARLLSKLGGGFARLPFNRKRMERAKESIAWCFPDWDADRVDRCAVESYRHLFRFAAELTWTPRYISADGFPFHVELGDLRLGLEELVKGGPSILVTGHCGNWELLGTTLAMLGVPVHAVYRPLDLKPLDEWLLRVRGAKGLTLVSKFGAAWEFDNIMEAGAPLGFIADQNAGDRGVFVPFFGRLASTYKAIALLAMRHSAPIICGDAVRLSGAAAAGSGPVGEQGFRDASQGFRYRIRLTDLIRPEDWAGQPDPVFYITARYRRAIENMVRSAPEQYLWMHRAWKSRPPHERPDREYKGFPEALKRKLEQLPWMTSGELDRIIARSARDAAELRGEPV